MKAHSVVERGGPTKKKESKKIDDGFPFLSLLCCSVEQLHATMLLVVNKLSRHRRSYLQVQWKYESQIPHCTALWKEGGQARRRSRKRLTTASPSCLCFAKRWAAPCYDASGCKQTQRGLWELDTWRQGPIELSLITWPLLN